MTKSLLDSGDEWIGLSITKSELEKREREHFDNGYAAGWHEGFEEGLIEGMESHD